MSPARTQSTPGGGLAITPPPPSSKWVKSDPNLPQSVPGPKKIRHSAPPRGPAAPPPGDSAAISAAAGTATALAAPAAPVSPAFAQDDALFYESRVVDSLGLARARLVALRRAHLTEPADFTTRDGAIVYTGAGLDRLLALTLPPEKIASLVPAPASPPPVPQVPPGPPPRVPLIVVKLPPNPRLLVCRHPSVLPGGATVVVRVRHSANFMPGMEITCIESPPKTYQFTGRLPARRGRW